MDFVATLIQEGYSESEIGEILETIYILDDAELDNLNEGFIYENRLGVEAIKRSLSALTKMPKNPWVTRQIAKLRKLLGGTKDKVDDAGKIVKDKADDAFTQTKPGSSTYKPGSKPSGSKPSGSKPDAKPTPKPKGNKPMIPGWVKNTAAAGAGVLIGTQLPQATSTDSDSSSTETTTTTTTPSTTSDPNGGKDKKPKRDYGWWKKTMPKMPGYSAEPGLSAYRNVRANEAYQIVLDYLISEGHADTVKEAEYVMNQMDFDHICDIVEKYTLNE